MSVFQRLRDRLNGPKTILQVIIFAALFFFGGLVASGAFASFTQYSNTMDFCLSCHEMESTVYQEYKESAHFQTKAGVRPSCADCHVPYKSWVRMVWHKVGATQELFYHITGEIDTAVLIGGIEFVFPFVVLAC